MSSVLALALSVVVTQTSPTVTTTVTEGADPGSPRMDPPPVAPPPPIRQKEPPPIPPPAVSFKVGKGIVLQTEDGNHLLNLRLRAQFLYTAQSDGDLETGFMIRRARVVFSGHVFSPKTKYKLELAISPRDQGAVAVPELDGSVAAGVLTRSPLLDFYFDFRQFRDLSLRVGQFKVPFSRERVISSGNLAFVDRSIVNSQFTLDRDIGASIHSRDFLGANLMRYHVGVYTNGGHSSFQLREFGMMYLARVEIAPLGLFKGDYDYVDFKRKKQLRLSLGAAYAFLHNATRDRGILGDALDDFRSDFHIASFDALAHFAGATLHIESFLRQAANLDLGSDPARNGFGVTGMLSYLLANGMQVGARSSVISGPDASNIRRQAEAGATVGYFWFKHSMKLQLDYFHIWNHASGNTDDPLNRVRLQLQAAF